MFVVVTTGNKGSLFEFSLQMEPDNMNLAFLLLNFISGPETRGLLLKETYLLRWDLSDVYLIKDSRQVVSPTFSNGKIFRSYHHKEKIFKLFQYLYTVQ